MKLKCKEPANWFQWHRWFAWRPVTVSPGDCRWLETVQRRIKEPLWAMGLPAMVSSRDWEYRAEEGI